MADFLATVDQVAKGGSALDPYVVGQLLHRTQRRRGLAQLTEREHDVLRLIAQGLTNAGVAKRLFLSERTVEAYVRRLLGKLDIADSDDAHRRVLAVLTYLRAGRPSLSPGESDFPTQVTAGTEINQRPLSCQVPGLVLVHAGQRLQAPYSSTACNYELTDGRVSLGT